MKKKLFFLSIGVLGLFSAANAQPPANVNGVQINGVNAVAGQLVTIGSVITFAGYTFAVIPVPDFTIDDPMSEFLEQQITTAFINARIVFDLNGDGVNNYTPDSGLPADGYGTESRSGGDAFFGFDVRNRTLQVVPFDFGISAVLGAGRLAAARSARSRRKKATAIA